MSRRRLFNRLALVVGASLLAAACSKDPEYAKREYLESGNRFYEQEKYNEAIVQYRNALQQDPQFGEARHKLAEAYSQVGDLRNALREYVRAADSLPNDVDVQIKAAQLLLATGQFEDARARAEKALVKDSSNVQAQIALGNALAGLRDFESAIKELEEAVRLDPQSAAAYTSLGSVQVVSGERSEAEGSFRKAVESSPGEPGVHMALANYLWVAGRQADAEQSFQKALELDPKNPLAHRALAAFYGGTRRPEKAEPHLIALAEADTSPSAPLKLALADYYIGMNRVDDGMKVLEGLVGRTETFAGARTRMAVVDYARKGKDAGRQGIDEVLEKDPKNVPALLVKARFLMADRKLDEALATATAAKTTDPASIQAHYLVGTIQRASNRPQEAVDAFNEVLKLNPRAVAAQVQLAQLTLAQGQTDAALQHAQDAAKALPSDPTIQLTLARSLIAKGQLVRADEIVKALVTKYPQVAGGHTAMGSLQLAKRDLPAARRAFTKAAELDPANTEAFSGLVALDFYDKKPDAARARVEAQLARVPNDSAVLLTAARAFASTGDKSRAEQTLRKAIEVNPADLNAYGYLGQLYASQNRLAEARASFEEIVVKQPNSIPAHTIIAMLYEMESNRPEARRRYERVLQIDPAAAVAANNLAYIYAEDGGNLDIALQLAQTARQKLPKLAEVTDTVGWVYLKKDLPTLALPLLEEAHAGSPNHPTIRYHLGQAYLKAGSTQKGRQVLEALVKDLPDSPEAAEATKTLASL